MAEYNSTAREANASLRARHGRTAEVERAVQQAQMIRRESGGVVDYPKLLAECYELARKGRKNGKQKIS